jgi:tripartite-type tricarboxylate transporter receptor subunit TctC
MDLNLLNKLHAKRRFTMIRKITEILFVSMIIVLGPILIPKDAPSQEVRYPTKPIKLIIGSAPGASSDLPIRALAKVAEKILGQPINCFNSPGGGGIRALGTVLNEKPDGYTLVTVTMAPVIAGHMEKLSYSISNDFTPIIQVQNQPMPFAVRKDARWNTWQEVIKYLRESNSLMKVGIWGAKGTNWLALTQVEKRENVKFVYVPFTGGGETISAILGGHIDASMATSSIMYAKSGELKLLLVFSDQRLKAFPNIPTGKELYGPEGVGFGGGFGGIIAPKGLPKPVQTKLHDAFKKAMEDPEYLAINEKFDLLVSYKNPEDFGHLLRRTEEVIKDFAKE